jgi:Transglutaminase-like superfamily
MQPESEVTQKEAPLTVDLTQTAQESEAIQRKASGSSLFERITRFPATISKVPSTVKTMRRMGPDEKRYLPPPRAYELPVYRKGMKYCTSKEKYLRPRRLTNPREHNIVALAHELGAFELSDREFAEAAYWWVKSNLWWELGKWHSPGNVLAIGRGNCWNFNNVLVALCRCAGIKSRFKAFKMEMWQSAAEELQEYDQGLTLGSGKPLPEAEPEIFIDGTWEPAYVAQNSRMSAAAGFPICEFGETGAGLYFKIVPGSTQFSETVPLMMAYAPTLMSLFIPATVERINVAVMEAQDTGGKDIEKVGGLEAYNRIARKRRESFSPDEIMELMKEERAAKVQIKKPE